jgi:hypothetical protein
VAGPLTELLECATEVVFHLVFRFGRSEVSILGEEGHALKACSEPDYRMRFAKHLNDKVMSVIGLSLHSASDRRKAQGQAYHRVLRTPVIRVQQVD